MVIEQIKNASVLYSQNEGIIEQAKTTEKYYNDILQAYGLRSSDLENPAIAENLYKKLNEKTTRTQKENDFLQVLK